MGVFKEVFMYLYISVTRTRKYEKRDVTGHGNFLILLKLILQ